MESEGGCRKCASTSIPENTSDKCTELRNASAGGYDICGTRILLCAFIYVTLSTSQRMDSELSCYLVQNPSKKKKGANRKMKITFNDGQELQIQQVTEQPDGALLIKTISAHEDQLKTLFSDQTTTKRMSVSERDADTVVYENYTKLDAIVKYTAGILGVLMYREGEDPDSQMTALKKENADMKEKIEQLQGCILEMSELVYQ